MKQLMSLHRYSLVVALSIALLAGACGSDSAQTAATGSDEAQETPTAQPDSSDAAEPTAADSWDTTAGVEAAQWGDNVAITIGDATWRFESNGIPNHELPDQFLVPQTGSFTPPVTEAEVSVVDTSVAVTEVTVDETITLAPVYSDETSDTNLGLIGVTISGAQLFNDYEDPDRSFVAVDDNFSIDGVFFVDSCNGHPLALQADGTGGGNYHYHGIPYCLTDIVDTAGEHSTVLGFLVDGFPFYGPQGLGGATVTSDELDECSGHVEATPEFPNDIYHYHLTEDRSPYTVDCYHGEVAAGNGQAAGAPGDDEGAAGATGDAGGPGGPPDFTDAAAALGVTADELQAALGTPPFDMDAAAEALGISAADLQDALPAPPGGGDNGPAPAQEDTAEAPAAQDVDEDELAIRSLVLENAQWADSVTISIDGTTVRFESDGLPSHEYLDVYLGDGRDGKFIAGGVDAYAASFEFPIVPTMAATPSSTGNGAIGVAISGAVYFDPYEGNGSDTVANDDNTTIDGIPFIDACGGHPLPNGISYHYHGIPFCITDAVDTAGEHSVLIGYLFDGYPIYGPQDTGGNEPTDLDSCLGHTGATPEFDDDTYHYHVVSTANYISECLSGIS